MEIAVDTIRRAIQSGFDQSQLTGTISHIVVSPQDKIDDPLWGSLAQSLKTTFESQSAFIPREQPAAWKQWGTDLEHEAVCQMSNACKLPITVAGALMPDAHVGYGLPIGGVLATKNAVIPYAVGVDIACRMKLTVLDLPTKSLETKLDKLKNAIERETQFGIGASFKHRRQHEVMDADWSVSPVTYEHKDKAWKQLGTSGSGNHFVEFGTMTLEQDDLGLEKGVYLAL